MTCIGNKLSEAGYYTGQAGKWHLGLATPSHTPKGRGYQHSLTYLDGANDCEAAIIAPHQRRAARSPSPSLYQTGRVRRATIATPRSLSTSTAQTRRPMG
jgi:arylsulfatase I/J